MQTSGTEGGHPDSWIEALRSQAARHEAANDRPAAEACHREIVHRLRQSDPDGLDTATAFHDWGRILWQLDRLEQAQECHTEALRLRHQAAPDSLLVAASLHNLAVVHSSRGELRVAESLLRQAQQIRELLVPDSAEVALGLNNLGNMAARLGDFGVAEQLHRRALTLREQLCPESLDLAATLNNLGLVLLERGDLVAAELCHRKALHLREVLAPESLQVAHSLANLGIVARRRSDLAAAQDRYQRAVALVQAQASNNTILAVLLHNLAEICTDRGQLTEARLRESTALEVWRQHVPDSPDIAESLGSLARIAQAAGDLQQAEALRRQALQSCRRVAPDSLHEAKALQGLVNVLLEQETFTEARGLALRALEIVRQFAPGSFAEAQALGQLAQLGSKTGSFEEALRYGLEALTALEAQGDRLGGAQEVRSASGARYRRFYDECLEWLVRLGRPSQAFELLERAKARVFLSALAQRDVVLDADVPPQLLAEKHACERELQEVQSLWNAQPSADPQSPLAARLRDLRDRHSVITARILQQSARLASLHPPASLDVKRACAALEPGTVLVAYWVSARQTYVFTIAAGPDASVDLRVLPIDEPTLRAEIDSYRRILGSRPSGAIGPHAWKAVLSRGQRLYRLLLQPIEHHLAAAQRVLICPDGPLHALPFGALVRSAPSDSTGAGPEYLIVWKPLHTCVSMTVYSQLSHRPMHKPAQGPTLALFGDPSPGTGSGDTTWQPWRVPLPGARDEIEAIAAIYGPQALLFTGPEASVANLELHAGHVQALHVAAHCVLDELMPLNSSIVLAATTQVPERLYAWQIFEHLRLQAQLVTLSGCETALGAEMGGEGLMGLTRAFHHAGARSVVASLWKIQDRSSALLMQSFYTHWRSGLPKDEALRQAQIERLSTEGSAGHPFHWAGFVLLGPRT